MKINWNDGLVKWRLSHWFANKFRNSLLPDKLLDYLLRMSRRFAFNGIDVLRGSDVYVKGGSNGMVQVWYLLVTSIDRGMQYNCVVRACICFISNICFRKEFLTSTLFFFLRYLSRFAQTWGSVPWVVFYSVL